MPSHLFSIISDSTERIDRFLADQLTISRTQAGQVVAAGRVAVNGKQARRSQKLSRGNEVLVDFPEEAPRRQLARHDIDLVVAYEDDSILVIDKPAGLVVHPAPGHWDDTLLNALVAHGVKLSSGDAGRPGIVHRLDKDTSGLILVAKTDKTHRDLSRAIAARRVTREYAALVWGHFDNPVSIDAPLARNPNNRKLQMVLATGREARTIVTPVARFHTCDLVRVRLDTGRTHQIRVHLAHVGHPVVGDPVYGGGGAKRMSGPWQGLAREVDKSVDRQALHATILSFVHPESGESMTLRSEWAVDLRPCMSVAAEDPTLLDRENPLEYLGFFGQEP